MPTPDEQILTDEQIAEIEAQVGSGSLLLPLRVEGWHKSLTDGGWHIKNASGRIVMTVSFVPIELETGKPALDGNAPARHTAALLNAIPALCATVKQLRAERQDLWFFLTRRPVAQLSHAELIAVHKDMANERDDLQSQLEQLREENERLRTERGVARTGDFNEQQGRLREISQRLTNDQAQMPTRDEADFLLSLLGNTPDGGER